MFSGIKGERLITLVKTYLLNTNCYWYTLVKFTTDRSGLSYTISILSVKLQQVDLAYVNYNFPVSKIMTTTSSPCYSISILSVKLQQLVVAYFTQ